MMTQNDIKRLLSAVVHPETRHDIVAAGMVESVNIGDGRISVVLIFAKSRDPFATAIKRQVQQTVEEAYPDFAGNVSVIIKERAPAASPSQSEQVRAVGGTSQVSNVIAVASGKGGVGKSTVTANLAVTLAAKGYRVGLLDADIYGPSQPTMFGIEGFMPEAVSENGKDMILPPTVLGVKLMSIGFFIKQDDALIWRGAMATNALRQLVHQTAWGELDFLLIDMPPGTGDVHLTIIQELKVSGAVIVTTPQKIATIDVLRGVRMFQADKIEIPVLGIIENMSWFTPAELPENRYYIFGKGGATHLAEQTGLDVLGEIPLVQSVMDGADTGVPVVTTNPVIAGFYDRAAETIINKLK